VLIWMVYTFVIQPFLLNIYG
jgi:hypothetical protein